MPRFTDKQRAFIDNYIKTLNATEAARRAKYKGSDNTLAAVGYENLRKPYLRAEIDRRLRDLSITDEEILFRLQRQATADIGNALNDYGGIDLEKMLEMGDTAVIKKFKVTKTGREIELYDSQAALIHLFKLRRLLDGKPTAILKIQQAIESGAVTKEQIKERYPALADELFSNVG